MDIPSVVVVTSAFGADLVRARGQAHFLPLVARAGANGVEIRRELFTGPARDLKALRELLTEHNLYAIYSAPLSLWRDDGTLAVEELGELLGEAALLDAQFLKITLGHYGESCNVLALAALLSASNVRVLIENDQTSAGGRIAPLAMFFASCRDAGVPIGMVFDTGNWCWTGTDPAQAAMVLGSHVEYVHCKAVTTDGGRLRVVPLNGADPNWRELFRNFPENVPRAIEFPLLGESLELVTRDYIERLRIL